MPHYATRNRAKSRAMPAVSITGIGHNARTLSPDARTRLANTGAASRQKRYDECVISSGEML